MKHILSGMKSYIAAHKILSTAAILVILGGGYWVYASLTGTTGETKYVIAAVEKGTIMTTVSGSGQVSATNEVELSPKASGDLTYLNAIAGQKVKEGDLIAQINNREAQLAYENAVISYNKLVDPSGSLSLVQAQNSLSSAKESEAQAELNLSASYGTAFNTVASTFIDFSSIIQGMNTTFYTQAGLLSDQNSINYSSTVRSYRDDAGRSLDQAKAKYDTNLAHYKETSLSSSSSTLEALVDETYGTTQTLLEAVKNAKNAVDLMQSRGEGPSNLTTTQSSLNGWLSTLTSRLNSLLSAKNSIADNKQAIVTAERSIDERARSLSLIEAPDSLDVRTKQLDVEQKRTTLANYSVRAPFSGTIAKVNVKKSDSVNSGTSIVTLISDQQVADILLNEVDAAKVAVGQNVTLTFDAVDGLTITGKVIEVDLVGTVSQGVVSYNVKIGFDTQDARVKSGMSVSATIVTQVKQDVLIVPASAVKSAGDISYVEMPDQSLAVTNNQGVALTGTLKQQQVELGLSDDTNVEVVSGLAEGDKVITRTIAASTQTTAAAAGSSLFGGSRTTGAVRIPR